MNSAQHIGLPAKFFSVNNHDKAIFRIFNRMQYNSFCFFSIVNKITQSFKEFSTAELYIKNEKCSMNKQQFRYNSLGAIVVSAKNKIDTCCHPSSVEIFSIPNCLSAKGCGFEHQITRNIRYFHICISNQSGNNNVSLVIWTNRIRKYIHFSKYISALSSGTSERNQTLVCSYKNLTRRQGLLQCQ